MSHVLDGFLVVSLCLVKSLKHTSLCFSLLMLSHSMTVLQAVLNLMRLSKQIRKHYSCTVTTCADAVKVQREFSGLFDVPAKT